MFFTQFYALSCIFFASGVPFVPSIFLLMPGHGLPFVLAWPPLQIKAGDRLILNTPIAGRVTLEYTHGTDPAGTSQPAPDLGILHMHCSVRQL